VEALAHHAKSASLPAIAAVAAISPAPASTATTIPAAPTSSAPASTAAITAPAATAALCLGTRFIYNEVPSAKILAIQRIDGAVRVFVVGDLDEGETARLPRKTIADEIHSRGSHTDLRKPLVQLILRRGKRKIPDIKLLHLSLLLPGT
jgi:hypothetical protein